MSDKIVYGIPFSQPVRAVLRLMLIKKMSFVLKVINPGSSKGGSRHPEYLKKFPAGTIPSFEDPDIKFYLSESHAIMCYLCNKYQWHDVYPNNPEERAKVDSYLNLHQRSLREASIGLVAPKVRKDLNFTKDFFSSSRTVVEKSLNAIEKGWLHKTRFLCGDNLTIADISAYTEIGQLQSIFTNIFDFSSYSNIGRWLGDMQDIDCHDDVHLALYETGDISKKAPSIEVLKNANIQGIKAIYEKLESIK